MSNSFYPKQSGDTKHEASQQPVGDAGRSVHRDKTNPERLYTRTFYIGFVYNFLTSFVFSNNAMYPLYIEHGGGGAGTIGLFMGFFSVSGVLGRPVIGSLVDRFGVKPVLMAGALIQALPCFGFLFLLDGGLSPMIWVLRFLQGVGWGMHMTAFFTLAAQAAPSSRRNEALSMYGMSGLASNLIGPISGEILIERLGFGSFFWMLAGLGLASFLLITLMEAPKRSNHSERFELWGMLTLLRSVNFRFACLLALLLSASFSTISAFIAPIARERGIVSFGLFFTAFSLSGVLIRVIGSRWGDRHGSVRVLVPGFLFYAAGLLTLHFSHSLTGVLWAGLLSGIGHGIAFPAVAVLGYSLAPSAMRGSGVALITGMMDGGYGLTAVTLGTIGRFYGIDSLFAIGACAPLSATILILLLGRLLPPGSNSPRS